MNPELKNFWDKVFPILQKDEEGRLESQLLNLLSKFRDEDSFKMALADFYRKKHQEEVAIVFFREYLDRFGSDPQSHFILGLLLESKNNLPDALEEYEKTIELAPESYVAHYCKGNVEVNMGHLENALKSFDRALTINENFSEAICNKANVLSKLSRFSEAIQCYKTAAEILPPNNNAVLNLICIYNSQDEVQKAIDLSKVLLERSPGNRDGLYYLSVAKLKKGDFDSGFQIYDNRFFSRENKSKCFSTEKQLWSGGYIDSPVLIWPEQGVGDQILFCRLLKGLHGLSSRFIVALDDRLVSLLKTGYEDIQVIETSRVSELDFLQHIPLGSVGRYVKPSIGSLLRNPPDYIRPKEPITENLSMFLANLKLSGKIIGISWRSSAPYGSQKSIPLDVFRSALRKINHTLISLQYDKEESENLDRQDVGKYSGVLFPPIDHYNDLNALSHTIKSCDLVLTISNVTAHLAGALRIPCIVFLPFGFGKHWYWGVGEGVSDWYPSVTRVCRRENESWSQTLSRGIETNQQLFM